MKTLLLDEKWTFRRGLLDSLGIIDSYKGETVNLPHDGMIGLPVDKNAQAVTDSDYVSFGTGNPITTENYKDTKTTTFRGQATAIVRSGYENGSVEISLLVETGKQDAGK